LKRDKFSGLRWPPWQSLAEYLALKQSVVELTAMGRNLNQIARAMNQGGRAGLAGANRSRRHAEGRRGAAGSFQDVAPGQ